VFLWSDHNLVEGVMRIQGRTTHSQPAAGLERLARVVAGGASPSRTAAVACALVAELRSRPDCWRERLEHLQTELEESIGAAEEYAADLDEAGRPMLLAQLDALRAARAVLHTETVRAQEQGSAAPARDPGRWLGSLRHYG
jgi:hypothetical protein